MKTSELLQKLLNACSPGPLLTKEERDRIQEHIWMEQESEEDAAEELDEDDEDEGHPDVCPPRPTFESIKAAIDALPEDAKAGVFAAIKKLSTNPA